MPKRVGPDSKGTDSKDVKAVRKLMADVDSLRSDVRGLLNRTKYEDLEHAELGLEIVNHALEEVAEHKGMGGEIKAVSDHAALKAAKELKKGVEELSKKAKLLLKTHSEDEDLQTAIKALEISHGSFEEVERYS